MKELRELRKEPDAAVKPGHEQVVDRLFDVIEKLANRCERLEKENQRLRQRIAELEKQDLPASTLTTGAASSFSLDAEQKRRQRKDRKRKTTTKCKSGRKPNKDKLACVARWVDILPEGARTIKVHRSPTTVLLRAHTRSTSTSVHF
jgi:hypothetical protein